MNAEQYDKIPYKSLSFAQSNPHRLQSNATILGLNPPPISNANILEIGCSFGGNLIPFALQNPDAKLLGIDLSSEQIKNGKEITKQLAVQNLELECMDVTQFSKKYPNKIFDYIIVHGVYSWVPNFVKDAILNTIKTHLSKNGVAYISYNVYPGWKEKDVLRKIIQMAFNNKNDLQFAKECLIVYRDFLQENININNFEQSVGAKSLIYNINRILQSPDYYIIHEYLEENNNPLFFIDFINELSKHDLTYLCESGLEDIIKPQLGHTPSDEFIEKHFNDRINLEAWNDIFSNKVFRTSLIVHKEAYPQIEGKKIGPMDINKIHIISNPQKTLDENYTTIQNQELLKEFNWVYQVFSQVFPASINLGEMAQLLQPEERLNTYAGILQLLDTLNQEAIKISTKKFYDIKYEPCKTRLKPNLRNYIEYFFKTENPMITLSNELGTMYNIDKFESFVMLQFDGILTKEQIAKKALEFANKIGLEFVTETKNTKKQQLTLAKEYVDNTEIMLRGLYFLEQF